MLYPVKHANNEAVCVALRSLIKLCMSRLERPQTKSAANIDAAYVILRRQDVRTSTRMRTKSTGCAEIAFNSGDMH